MPFNVPVPLARYRLHGIVERRLAFPDFAGSALRGAFGHALRRAACVTGQDQCDGCPLRTHCTYSTVFEPAPLTQRGSRSRPPVPYVIEPPAPGPLRREAGQAFDFELVLVGPALRHLALLLRCWQQALAADIGAQGRVRLTHVTDADGERIFDADDGRLQPHAQLVCVPPAPDDLQQVRLQFSTPLELTRNGRPVPADQIGASDLLLALARRCADIMTWQWNKPHGLHFDTLKQASSTLRWQAELQPCHWQRHSSRQQRSMPMGGLLGSWQLHGDLTPFWPLLYLGQWLHLGKKASFGQGRYHLQILR